VVAGAGDGYGPEKSEQGMAFPAIVRETVSVGAVFDSKGGAFTYASGARVYKMEPGQITPFSQRLHEKVDADARTDIFAPGAFIPSSGTKTDEGSSLQTGTSGAAAIVSGVILLMQECHLRTTESSRPWINWRPGCCVGVASR
jgi:serine protease AprX